MYHSDDAEGHGSLDRDDEDMYFDDESAEVVISSLRLGNEQGSSLFTNSNWFAFQDDDRNGDAGMSASPSSDMMDDNNLNRTSNSNSSSDDEVVVGEDDELESKNSAEGSSSFNAKVFCGFNAISNKGSESFAETKSSVTPGDSAFFPFKTPDSDDPFGEDRPISELVAWGETSDFQVGGSIMNSFDDPTDFNNLANSANASSPPVPPSSGSISNGTTSTSIDSCDSSSKSDSSNKGVAVPSLFEEDVELVGTEKAMEHALKEGIVVEAGPMKRIIVPKKTKREDSDNDGAMMKELRDSNYWKVEHEVVVLE